MDIPPPLQISLPLEYCKSFIFQSAPEYEVNKKLHEIVELSDGKCIPYAGVTGTVEPQGNALHSYYRNEQGVIQKLTLTEHCTKRTQGYW